MCKKLIKFHHKSDGFEWEHGISDFINSLITSGTNGHPHFMGLVTDLHVDLNLHVCMQSWSLTANVAAMLFRLD